MQKIDHFGVIPVPAFHQTEIFVVPGLKHPEHACFVIILNCVGNAESSSVLHQYNANTRIVSYGWCVLSASEINGPGLPFYRTDFNVTV